MFGDGPRGVREISRPDHAARPGQRPIDVTGVPEIRAHQRFDLLMRFGRVEAHRPRDFFLELVREDVGVAAVLHVQHRPDPQQEFFGVFEPLAVDPSA